MKITIVAGQPAEWNMYVYARQFLIFQIYIYKILFLINSFVYIGVLKIYFFFLPFIFLSSAQGQSNFVLKVIPVDKEEVFRKLIKYKQNFPDSLSPRQELSRMVNALHHEGFISASIDSILYESKNVTAYLLIGEKYEWSFLRKGHVNDLVLEKIGFKEKFYRNELFRYQDFARLEQKIIQYSENHGFPFASIGLDSIQIKDNTIYAVLKYKQGPLILFDTLDVQGKSRTKKKFLSRHLRILAGQPFSQERITNMDRLLRELPYISKAREPIIVFSRNKAKVTVFIDDKKTNQVDGIIGFLPNSATNSKLLVTGEMNLNLKNLFGTGKNIQVEWKKFKQQSQVLDLGYLQPKLFGSNLDMNLNLNLLKQDSTFINVNRKLTLIQNLSGRGKVSFFTGLKTSRQLIIKNNFIDSTRLPAFGDFDYYTYGIGYNWNNLNDLLYPHQGWAFSLQGFVGNKKIITSETINERIYKNLQVHSIQFSFNTNIEKYFKLSKKGVLLSRFNAGSLFNNNNVFLNDLFRVGGLKTLRGFNENNFFASRYGVATMEYRFFTDETSYLLLFYDQGYIYNQLDLLHPKDYPFGFGAGISFLTPAGVFNFVYSLGSSSTQKLSFNLSKIHFGLASRF
jgi:translocation and assembly module TamA